MELLITGCQLPTADRLEFERKTIERPHVRQWAVANGSIRREELKRNYWEEIQTNPSGDMEEN